MHEISIAEAILAIVEDHAGGWRVARVEVHVGRLRQVVPEALRFGFQLVGRGTVAQDAELVLRDVPVEGECRACGARSRPAGFPLACASCGGLDLEITSGEELSVESLDVTDEQPVYEEAS